METAQMQYGRAPGQSSSREHALALAAPPPPVEQCPAKVRVGQPTCSQASSQA
jgi:hypothetical protein